MKPSFGVLWASYPRKPVYDQVKLFNEIGWADKIGNGNFENTCAIRVSVALNKAGISIPGRLAAEGGKLKGRRIETSSKILANILKRKWGNPEVYKGNNEARRGLGQRTGVIAFFHLHGPTDSQGHIDLVTPGNGGFNECAGACYFDAVEIWFWPLK